LNFAACYALEKLNNLRGGFNISIILNSIHFNNSIVDGPGVRTVVFLQGCTRKCDGCQNPTTWDKNLGKIVEIDSVVSELETKCKNRKITISGGEPLEQYSAVLEFVKKLYNLHFSIIVYTSYELQEVPREILNYIDYIKVGKYQIEKTTTLGYVGSLNQQFIKIKGEKYEIY